MYTLAITYQSYLPRVAATLAVVCTVAAFLYGTFLLEAVAHAATRESAQRQIQTINEKLGSLEAQYLAKTQALTPAKAQAMGYVAPVAVSTVFATAQSSSLSFNGQ